MPANFIIPGFILFLHDMFTALWIGGLGFMAIVLLPGFNQSDLEMPLKQKLLQKFRTKFRPVVLISIIGLFVTGIFLARRSPLTESMFSFANTYSILLSVKHILVFVMILSVILQSALGRKNKSSRSLTIGNFIIGTVVVLMSAMTSIISSVPR